MGTMEGPGPIRGEESYLDTGGYTVNFWTPRYSKKWRLNPFPGTNVTMSILEDREPSWFHRLTTHWILGFEWERLTPKD